MKNIKDEYKKYIDVFIISHIILIYIILFGLNFNEIKNIFKDEFYKGTIILILPILSVVLNGVLPNSIKEFLVFWRFKNRLPGYMAFSKYAKNDARIDLNILKEKHPELKNENLDENKIWYKIYKKYVEYPNVWDSQKNYLFTRDIIGLIFLFFVLVVIVDFIIDSKNITILYALLIIEYFIIKIASYNYAVKFVINVLAEDSVK